MGGEVEGEKRVVDREILGREDDEDDPRDLRGEDDTAKGQNVSSDIHDKSSRGGRD